MRIRASPPPREPVKPTALMRGSATSAPPSQFPIPKSNENTPSASIAGPKLKGGSNTAQDLAAGEKHRSHSPSALGTIISAEAAGEALGHATGPLGHVAGLLGAL